MPKKRKNILIIVVVGVALFLGYRYFFIGEQTEVAVVSGGANFTSEQNRNYQETLINLNGRYLEAVLATNSVFFTDIESTSYEEWRERLEGALALWNQVEQEASNLDQITKDMEMAGAHSNAFPVLPTRSQGGELVPSAYAEAPETGAVTAVFDAAPPGKRLRAVMEVFKLDKRWAMYYLKQEQELLKADAWNKAGDTYKRWETAARALKDTCKVTVFVGTNIITAGGATAAVGALQGAGIVFGGASLVMEIGEDVYITIGEEDKAAVIKKTNDVLWGPAEYISLLSLNPDKLADPGNVIYMIDKAGQLINFIKDAKDTYINLKKAKEKGVVVVSDKPGGIKMSKDLPEKEVKTAGLPKGKKYRIDGEVLEAKKTDKVPSGTADQEDQVPTENINDIANIATVLAKLEAANTIDIKPVNTKSKTGSDNSLTVTIPEGFKPPFKVKDLSEGGSGGAIVVPSRINSNTFTAEFISSNPGVFSPNIQIIDADGNIVTGSTTIYVGDAEDVGEEIDIDELRDILDTIADEAEAESEPVPTPPVPEKPTAAPESSPPQGGGRASCPFIYVKKSGEWVIQNDIISVARATLAMPLKVQKSKQYTDYLPLEELPDLENNEYHLQVREIRDEISYLDHLTIHAVDHDSGTSISTDMDGNVWAFRKDQLEFPKNVSESLKDWGSSYKNVFHEDVLSFDFSDSKPTDDSVIVIRLDGFEGKPEGNTFIRPKIVFQTKDSAGNWVDRDFVYPREYFSSYALNTKDWFDESYEVRVKVYSCHILKYHRLDFIGIDVDGAFEKVEVKELDLDYPATSEENSNIKSALSDVDGNYYVISRGWWFEIASQVDQEQAQERTLVVETTGYYIALE